MWYKILLLNLKLKYCFDDSERIRAKKKQILRNLN